MSCSTVAIDFAWRQLAAISVLTGLEAAEIYDAWLEGTRHALLELHSWVGRAQSVALLPLIDLLTTLHCGSVQPVGSGTIAPRGTSVLSAEDARSEVISTILRSRVQLALVLPMQDPHRNLRELVAAHTLSDIMRSIGEDRHSGFLMCRRLSEQATALRLKGLSEIAPACVRADVVSLEGVRSAGLALLREGVQRWQLEMLLAAPGDGAVLARHRADLPPVRKRQRASFDLAMQAAAPSERARALQELDDEVLARTTIGPMESRLLVWRRLCEAWEVTAFPLDDKNVRAVGASLKRGRYRSAAQYYSAAVSFQVRRLHIALQPYIKALIRDCVRSIKRGLGPSALKDSFDVCLLAPHVQPGTEFEPFSWQDMAAATDALLVASYWCMREIEMAGASSDHLYFRSGLALLLLPVHKTAASGALTERGLACGCSARQHPLCPACAARRHVQRLEILQGTLDARTLPLFPGDRGQVLEKREVVQYIRDTLRRAGIRTTRPDEVGREVDRFGGHVLRVSGTQHLYLLGLRWDLVQLHGRWSSVAIQKYLQEAPLLQVPGTVAQALSSDDPLPPPRLRVRVAADDASVQARGIEGDLESCAPPANGGSELRGPAQQEAAALQIEFRPMRDAMEAVETLVVNTRTRRAHKPDSNEQTTQQALWTTSCGIAYGNSRFFRTRSDRPEWARCKRCFPSQDLSAADDNPESDPESAGSSSSLDSSSSSSSSD
ncbi:unnamed protein product [Symbiodinium sp. CCMP2592]|nr:unnamed protein product [Symbiodinium sp. CCMP2592]